MKTKIGAAILAGAFLFASALPVLAGGRAGGGTARGTGVQAGTRTQTKDQIQTRQRLRDGSCVEAKNAGASGAANKRGNTYGPGDGSGPVLPQDGTGYGAPANR